MVGYTVFLFLFLFIVKPVSYNIHYCFRE